jgi:PAS domain S-box-containing protein
MRNQKVSPAFPMECASRQPTIGDLTVEIEKRLGLFPPLFAAAGDSPLVLESMWNQMRSGYLDNPLPASFKEKLQARLARCCAMPRPIVCHTTALRELGSKAREILELLELPIASDEGELNHHIQVLESEMKTLSGFPEQNSAVERSLLHCALFFFAKPGLSSQLQKTACRLLGYEPYGHLMALLSYIKSYHFWVESHPGPPIETVPHIWDRFIVMLREEPRLVKLFRNYRERNLDRNDGGRDEKLHRALPAEEIRDRNLAGELSKAMEILKDEISKRKRLARELLIYRERLDALLEHTSDLVFSYDSSGSLLSLNRAAERLTGYRREEAVRMKVTQLVAPDCAQLAERLVDPRACAEEPATFELGILTKDSQSEILRVHQQLLWLNPQSKHFQIIGHSVRNRISPLNDKTAEDKQSGEMYRQKLAEFQARAHQKLLELVKNKEILETQIAEQKRHEEALLRAAVESDAKLTEAHQTHESDRLKLVEQAQTLDSLRHALHDIETRSLDQTVDLSQANERLQAQERDLRNALADSETKLHEALKVPDNLRAQIEQQQGAIAALQQSLSESAIELSYSIKELASLRTLTADHQGEKEALRSLLEGWKEEVSRAKCTHELLQATISKNEVETVNLRIALAIAESGREDTLQAANVHAERITGLESEKESLQRSLTDLEGSLAEAVSARDALALRTSRLETDNEQLSCALGESSAQFEKLRGDHESLLATIAVHEVQTPTLRSSLADAVQTAEDFTARIAELEDEKESHQRSLANLEGRLVETLSARDALVLGASQHEKEKEELRHLLGESNARFDELRGVYESLRATIARHELDTAALRGALAEALHSANVFKARIPELQDEKGSMQRSLADLEGRLAETVSARDALVLGAAQHEKEKEELRHLLGESNARFDELRGVHESLQATIARHELDTAALRASLAEALHAADAFTGRIEVLEGEKESLQRSLIDLERSLAETLSARDALALKTSRLEKDTEQLSHALGDSSAQFDELRGEYESLQATIAEQEAQSAGLRAALAEGLHAAEVFTVRIEELEGEKESLQHSLADLEGSLAETLSTRDSLALGASQHEKAEAERNRQLTLLSEMGSLLRACEGRDEALAVIAQEVEQIFPAYTGALYLVKSGEGWAELVFEWGGPPSSKAEWLPDECFAVRRNCMHVVRDGRSKLLCRHIQPPIPGSYICIPIEARRHLLGMFHLSARTPGQLTATEQRVAATVAESITMVLSNLMLRPESGI